jgi:HEAT repeat protein
VKVCISRGSSERAGTRYWAVDELGILRDPSALPAVLALFNDREPEVAVNAFRAASATLQQHPRLRGAVVRALEAQVRSREVVRSEALATIAEIQASHRV